MFRYVLHGIIVRHGQVGEPAEVGELLSLWNFIGIDGFHANMSDSVEERRHDGSTGMPKFPKCPSLNAQLNEVAPNMVKWRSLWLSRAGSETLLFTCSSGKSDEYIARMSL